MNDYIERNKALNELCLNHRDVIYIDKQEAVARIRAIPKEDVVKILRCKDCKYAHLTYDGQVKYCDMWKDDDDYYIELYLDGDWFCADGERKDNGN